MSVLQLIRALAHRRLNEAAPPQPEVYVWCLNCDGMAVAAGERGSMCRLCGFETADHVADEFYNGAS